MDHARMCRPARPRLRRLREGRQVQCTCIRTLACVWQRFMAASVRRWLPVTRSRYYVRKSAPSKNGVMAEELLDFSQHFTGAGRARFSRCPMGHGIQMLEPAVPVF